MEGEPLPGRCSIEAWHPSVDGIAEVFHAQIVDYAYPRHCHDSWAVLIVDTGAISYELDHRKRDAFGQVVTILPPGVTHDGRPAPGADGFGKRVLYLDESVLPHDLIGAAVDRAEIEDATLRRMLADLHDDLRSDVVSADDRLRVESGLCVAADRIGRHLRRETIDQEVAEPDLARRLRELLDGSLIEPVGLDEAAAMLNRSKPHLVRTFTSAYGLAPHAYVIGRRVDAARKLLLQGQAAADVATAVGFYDQAHLTRHFKRHTSAPPAAFAASHRLR